jgi:ribosome-associated protein
MTNNISEVPIFTKSITLDSFLKWAGIAETGGHAKQLIQDGQVTVNNAIEFRRSRKLSASDIICVDKMCFRIQMQEHE